MRVLVFGAGGAIGRRLVREALDRGHEVTAVYRGTPPADADGVTVENGDVRTPLAIPRLAEQDAVICAVGAGASTDSPDYAIYLDAAHALVPALRSLGERGPRLIVVGGAGSLQVGPDIRLVDTPQFPAHFREEALAQARALEYYRAASGVRWTYVSPAALLQTGTRTGRFRTGGDQLLIDEQGHSRISIEDYAAALMDELERPQAIGRRMTVAY